MLVQRVRPWLRDLVRSRQKLAVRSEPCKPFPGEIHQPEHASRLDAREHTGRQFAYVEDTDASLVAECLNESSTRFPRHVEYSELSGRSVEAMLCRPSKVDRG